MNSLVDYLNRSGEKPTKFAASLRSFIIEAQHRDLDPEIDEGSLVEDCKIFYKHLDGRWWNDFHVEDLK